MIRVGGAPAIGVAGQDTEFCGLLYPDGDEISKHMAERLRSEPFYQSDKLQQALAVVKQRRGAIDCGAWVGGWTRELARHFEFVVSIEANKAHWRCVVKNVGHAFNVWCVHSAVGDRTGLTSIDHDPAGARVGTRIRGDHGDTPIHRIDDLPAVHRMQAIDYIKVHVNGMELKVLRGAADTIRKHRPVMTVVLKPALADYGDTPEAAREFLGSLGYRPAGGERPYEIWAPR